MQPKFEMEELKKMQAKAMSGATELSWSEVSRGDGEVKPPPPPPRSRSPTRRCLKIQEKFTPRGTRVPDTLPAPDVAMSSAVPPWPIDLSGYEKCEEKGPCGRTWGPSLRGKIREWPSERPI